MISQTSHLSRREALRSFGLIGAAALFSPAILRAAGAAASTPKAGASDAALAGSQPGFYRMKIGAHDALVLNDGGAAFPVGAAWPSAPAEPVQQVLDTAFLPKQEVRLPFNVLLVKIGSELVLVDTGCGNLYGPAGGRLAENLAAAGVKPEQVTMLILTHAHGDHHGGLVDPISKQPVFRNAKHFINRAEHDFWMGNNPDLSAQLIDDATRKQFVQGAQSALGALKGKWQFIKPGDKLLDGLEIVDAPGHTPGHIALLVSSGSDQLLHFVDTAHHYEVSMNRPQEIFFGDAQPPVAIATRRKLLDRAAADKLRVMGAHMPFPALGHVRSQNGHYEFKPEAWMV